LVFIDESGAKTNMTRLYGRAFGGKRAVDTAPHGHWCTTTMISTLGPDGSTADMVLEGAAHLGTGGRKLLSLIKRVVYPNASIEKFA